MEALSPPAPNSSSDLYVYLPQTRLKSKDLFAGKLIHAWIIKVGLHLGVFLMNNLMNFYAKVGSASDVHRVFDDMTTKNTFSWNTILSAYAKQGRLDKARRVFEDIPDHDSVSWISMIVGYNEIGHFENVIKMFVEMIGSRISPAQYTNTNVLASCASIEALDIGRKVHSFVIKHGLGSCIPVANSTLNMYAKCGDSITEKFVFDRMRLKNTSSWNVMFSLHMESGWVDLLLGQFKQMAEQDVVSWNSMVACYNRNGFDVKALEIFSNMLKDSSLKPDKFTLASALSACNNLEKFNPGKRIRAYIIRTKFDTSGAVANALVSMYAKSGGVEIARKIVEQSGYLTLNVIAFYSPVGWLHQAWGYKPG